MKPGPEGLFDQGYACWLETYPGEKEDIAEERHGIVQLLQKDQKKYLETIQRWNIDRIIAKLKEEGWRKDLLA